MIEADGNDVLIHVRVIPRAGRTSIAGTRDNALLVRLAAAPVDGAANAQLIDVLARALDVPKRTVTICEGERSRHKRVRVEGMTSAEIRVRLQLPPE